MSNLGADFFLLFLIHASNFRVTWGCTRVEGVLAARLLPSSLSPMVGAHRE